MLSAYKDDHFGHIVLGFFAIYNFLQTFAIPGSIFLSILSGFLFPFPLACFLVSLCSALGASFCYLLRCIYGREGGSLVERGSWVGRRKRRRERKRGGKERSREIKWRG